MSGLNGSAKHDLDSVCCSIKPPTEQAHQQTIQHPKLLLVNEVSSCVDLSQGQFEVVFVIQYVDKVSIEWVYILNKNKQILMTKPTKWHVRPAKTQISLGIHPVRSESSLSA